MSIIASKILFWAVVSDASTYRIRVTDQNAVANDFSDLGTFPFDEVTAVDPNANTEQEFDIAEMISTVISDGTYDIFISAVDEAGNESDPLFLEDNVLDFQPPLAPTSGGFR